MTRRSARLPAALLALAAGLVLPSANPADTHRRAAALVGQLGDDDFRTREAATDELLGLGEPALPAVLAGANSADPEVRTRAGWLFHQLLRQAGASKSTGMTLVPVHGREFRMGSPPNEVGRRADEHPHSVRLTRAFLIGDYEVTQEEFRKVTGRAPSHFSPTGGGKGKLPKGSSDRFPVEQVTWFDAVDFCNRLSKLDGFEPYYALADERRTDGALTAATVTVAGGPGYRLPTEAEWELAARGRTDTAFHFGRRAATGKEGNFRSVFPGGYGGDVTVFLGRTAAVGSYPRNRAGLYDAHGNVAEWCGDWYDKDAGSGGPRTDPTGPAAGTHRAVRGGSWMSNDTSCRSAARGSQAPGEATYATGFRVARSPH